MKAGGEYVYLLHLPLHLTYLYQRQMFLCIPQQRNPGCNHIGDGFGDAEGNF